MPTNIAIMADQAPEVICTLKNSDGSHCRKRCTGDKRYRSMIEHVRRVHSQHYIPKLPATEESFNLMVNTPPSDRPPQPPRPPLQQQSPRNTTQRAVGASPLSSIAHLLQPLTTPASNTDYNNTLYKPDLNYAASRSSGDYRRPSLLQSANAAEVLAQLHSQQPLPMAWEQEHGYQHDGYTDTEMGPRLAPMDPPMDPRLYDNDRYPDPHHKPQRELLNPSLGNRSPPYHRSSTLPPAGRLLGNKPNRPRKSSITQNARKPKHERTKSKDHQKRMSYDRKAMSAEPSSLPAIYGKRWEDLIDAAASATEEDRDLTPVPPSPKGGNRNSLPPLLFAPQFQNHTFTGSPLARALTPPAPENNDLQPFPSVESSVDSKQSGHNFHISAGGLSDSSPQFTAPVQIYCAGCHRLSILRDSYACTECICGVCKDCVDAFYIEKARHRGVACPKCSAYGGKFKPFQLDIR